MGDKEWLKLKKTKLLIKNLSNIYYKLECKDVLLKANKAK